MSSDDKALARLVKEYRLSRLWTQNRMASHLEISRATYLRIELEKGCGDLTRAKITKIISQSLQAA